MKHFIYLSLLLALGLLTGCAGSPDKKSSYTTQDGERVSTIPWNRPQKWEGSGQLGGLGGN
jgi:hypothetical protein